jgi:choline dehydrogenase-like flavoprotein
MPFGSSKPPRQHVFTLAPAVVAPRSRGRLILRSSDPLVPLGIDLGPLTDPDGIDASVLLAGTRLARKIVATEPLAAETVGALKPDTTAQTDRELLEYANMVIQTVYHPTSTWSLIRSFASEGSMDSGSPMPR